MGDCYYSIGFLDSVFWPYAHEISDEAYGYIDNCRICFAGMDDCHPWTDDHHVVLDSWYCGYNSHPHRRHSNLVVD